MRPLSRRSSAIAEPAGLAVALLAPAVITLLLWMIVPLAMTLYFSAVHYNLMQPGEKDFAHVYAVAILPKDGTDDEDSEPYGLDTSADVGD